MFPFFNHNGYPVHPFSFNGSYEGFGQPQNDTNPYIYHYVSPNFPLQHEITSSNHFQHHQIPYFFQGKTPYEKEVKHEQKRKKRITKKIALTQVKKKIHASHAQFKAKKNTFKYLDPSRAPPITSLRNDRQLQMDFALKQQKGGFCESSQQKKNLPVLDAQQKLSIIFSQPDPINYPFLICKKRKYHRNLKRRYSVAYFEQRAAYITNKELIPSSLHPKNKVRKPRVPKINAQEVSDFSDNQISSESLSSQSESIQSMESGKKLKELIAYAENMNVAGMNQMKQENEISPPEKGKY